MTQTQSRSQPWDIPEEIGLASEKHPVLNPVIMARVFTVIPFSVKDFQRFRMVCKVWLKASLPRWRGNAWLQIKDKKDLGFNSHLDIKECEKMLMSEDPYYFLKYPFRRYKVCLQKRLTFIGEMFRGQGSVLFWTKLGSQMTHLKIYDSNIYSKDDVKKILTEMTPNLVFLSFESNPIPDREGSVPVPLRVEEWCRRTTPIWHDKLAPLPCETLRNLTEVEIRLGNGTVGFEFPVAWVYFLARCPNLKSLRLKEIVQWYRFGSLGKELQLLLRAILLIRERWNAECLSNLQSLDLLHAHLHSLSKFPSDVLLLLQQLNFPLTSFALDVGFQSSGAEFKEMLQLYSKTLKKLLVYRGPQIPGLLRYQFDTPFPFGIVLCQLTELRLIGVICENLHFLMSLPSLRVLVLFGAEESMEPGVLHLYADFWRKRLQDKVYGFHDASSPDTIRNVVAATNFFGEELKDLVLLGMEEFVVGNEQCSVDQLKHLGRLMPNLKKLRIGLGTEGFLLVCHMWTQLVHLDVDPCDIDQDRISGGVNTTPCQMLTLSVLEFLVWFRMGPPLNGARGNEQTGALLKYFEGALESTPNVKELHFVGTPKSWKKLGGKALISPLFVNS